MHPRLREDVHFLPLPGGDGALVTVPERDGVGFKIPGAQTCAWLERLAPFLTGEHPIDELCRGLDPARTSAVRAFVTRLHAEGAVRDAAADLPHTLTRQEREDYAATIGFIARSADSPEHRFQQYRDCHPVVVGAGQLVGPLVLALLATGVARVRALVTDDVPTDLARMRECVRVALGPAAEARIDVERADALPSPADARAVLCVSEIPCPGRLAHLARACAAASAAFGQATVIGRRAVLGPVGGPATLGAAWVQELDVSHDRGGAPHVAGPAAALVANHLCAALLKHVAGLDNELAGGFVEVDLETLQARRRPIAAAVRVAA